MRTKYLLTICLLSYITNAYSQYDFAPDNSDFVAFANEEERKEKLFSNKPKAPRVLEVKWSALEKILNSNTDTTYVVNFWATWCGPCVKELPCFEELNRNFASQKVRIVLVSMDFVQDREARLIPMVERMKLKSTVWLLNEPDANSWIEKVDAKWSGALPATLIFNPMQVKRTFYEKSFDYETLAYELSHFMDE